MKKLKLIILSLVAFAFIALTPVEAEWEDVCTGRYEAQTGITYAIQVNGGSIRVVMAMPDGSIDIQEADVVQAINICSMNNPGWNGIDQ